MKNSVSIIVTVLNERETIHDLLLSLLTQTSSAREIIICDGGSTDGTYEYLLSAAKVEESLKVFQRKGNISVGRNAAAQKATGKWLAITDAGCTAEPSWLEQLLITQEKSEAQIVAGFYKGDPRSSFEEAVVPYVLVQPSQAARLIERGEVFLPASRSMLISRNVFFQSGGFDESLDFSEDFDLAQRLLKKHGASNFAFSPRAIVNWRPRSNLLAFAKMTARFAHWDARAKRIRVSVTLLFARYVVWAILVAINWQFLPIGIIANSLFSCWKHSRTVQEGKLWLPIIQLISDFSVIAGTVTGYIVRYDVLSRLKSY